ALAVAAVAAPGCAPKKTAEPVEAPVKIRLARFLPSGAAGELVLPGRIKAAEEITIRSRLNARLTAFAVLEGDRVARGAVLARFDAPETRTALAAARAESEAATAALGIAVRQQARVESLYAANVVATR